LAGEETPKSTEPMEIAADAPDRYIVTPGDTLWEISSKFVKDPRRWRELWHLNDEQVKNPHRIYPGQVLTLRRGAEPYLELETVRLSPSQRDTKLTQEIPAIPAAVIEPYLARPLVIDAGALDTAPRIVALQDSRLMVGPGANIYVTGVKEQRAKTFQLYRPGGPLKDPITKEVLGYEADFLGTARLTQAGDPAIMQVSSAISQIEKGDHLTAVPPVSIVSYVPHAPKAGVSGRIMSVIGSVVGGTYSIVTVNLGKQAGMEVGHMLAMQAAGIEVTDTFKGQRTNFKLPDERYGLIFVFRVFDKVSYALVMQTAKEITVGDTVRTP
jgi:hypothetical protein